MVETATGGTATMTRTRTFDTEGRPATVSSGASRYSYGYDARDLLTSVSGLPTGVSTFGYHPSGLMRTRTDAAGTVNYEWNPDGTLAVAKDLSKANLDIRYKWTGGLLTGVDYAGSATRAGMKRSYGYDAYGRLTVDKLYLDPAYGPTPLGDLHPRRPATCPVHHRHLGSLHPRLRPLRRPAASAPRVWAPRPPSPDLPPPSRTGMQLWASCVAGRDTVTTRTVM